MGFVRVGSSILDGPTGSIASDGANTADEKILDIKETLKKARPPRKTIKVYFGEDSIRRPTEVEVPDAQSPT